MLAVEGGDRRFIGIRAAGLLRASDYRRFGQEFARVMQRRTRPVPLLLDMRGFHGWTPAAFVRDILWDIRNRNSFSRIAVVGDARWHEWSTYAGILLFRAKLRFFRSSEEAKQWLGVADRDSQP